MAKARRVPVVLAVLAGALVAALTALTGAGVQAQPNQDRIQSLRDQVQEASAEEARLLGLIDESTARRGVLDAKLADLDREMAFVLSDLRAAEARLGALEARQRGTQARLDEALAQMSTAKANLAHQAIAAYTGGPAVAGLTRTLLKAPTLGQLAARQAYVRAVASTQADLVASWERARDQVRDLNEELQRAAAQARGERDVVETQRAELEVDREALEALHDEVQAEVAERDRLRAVALARREEFQAEVAALEQQSREVAEALRQRQSSAASSASASSSSSSSSSAAPGPRGMSMPIPGAAVVSSFGPRVHPIFGDVRNHTGVDLSGGSGTPIRAAADGVVASAGWLGGYGYATIIDHGGSMATLYAHQSQMLVSSGQRVSRGQVVGRVGCTGSCTGPHLHYEVRIDGTPVNPAPYL